MELCMKQKVFSWKDRFTIFDGEGIPKYEVEGKLMSIAHQLTIMDEFGEEKAQLKQKLMTVMPKYFLLYQGEEIEIKQKLSILKKKVNIPSLGWTLNGNYTDHQYTILDNDGNQIMQMSKRWITVGDTYHMQIADGIDPILVLGIVVAVDCIIADEDMSY